MFIPNSQIYRQRSKHSELVRRLPIANTTLKYRKYTQLRAERILKVAHERLGIHILSLCFMPGFKQSILRVKYTIRSHGQSRPQKIFHSVYVSSRSTAVQELRPQQKLRDSLASPPIPRRSPRRRLDVFQEIIAHDVQNTLSILGGVVCVGLLAI